MILLQGINVHDTVNNVAILPKVKTEHNQTINATNCTVYIRDNVSSQREEEQKIMSSQREEKQKIIHRSAVISGGAQCESLNWVILIK